MKTLMLGLSLTFLVGCSSIRQVGKINGVEVHRITYRSLFAPNVTAIVTADPTKPGVIEFPVSANGPALAPALVGAAGNVGAAAVLGGAIRPSKTTVNNSADGGAGGNATGGAGGNATGGAGGKGGNATGGEATGGQAYSSAGATSSSASQSGSYSESSSWSGVIGSGNATVNNSTPATTPKCK